MNRNNTNFPLFVENSLNDIRATKSKLLYYQQLVVEYFIKNSKQRGILIAHETGTGKSIEAIGIAESLRGLGRRPIVFAAKSLQNNFKDNVKKYGIITGVEAGEYEYVSANANNVINQIIKISNSNLNVILNVGDNINPADVLEGSTIIVDEAHNLFNGIVSGSKNALKLYDIFMSVKDLKIVLLTSTIIINSPFEIVPCFNLLNGTILLPEEYEQFTNIFVNSDDKCIKNSEHLKARIFGLSSYYGSWFQTGGELDINMSVTGINKPTRLPFIEERIKMSIGQYSSFRVARRNEMDTSVGKKEKEPKFLQKPSGKSSSTYRIRSRQISNFWADEDNFAIQTAILNLDKYSPKFKKIKENIDKHGDEHGLIFSSFVEKYGLKWFALLLDSCGWVKYEKGMRSHAKRYAFMIGDLPTDDRSELLEVFNSDENIDGKIIQLILGSPAMAEGVDTKRIRHVHLMEAHWHFSAIEQIIARAVRFGSHNDLPDDKKFVQPYIYLSVNNNDLVESKHESTDENMYNAALEKKVLNNQFIKAIIESSIDCNIHIKDATDVSKKIINCMKCLPTNMPLYEGDITKQITKKPNCINATNKKIQVNEIEFAGNKFYYSKDPLKIYTKSENLGSYIEMMPNDKMYSALFSILTK